MKHPFGWSFFLKYNISMIWMLVLSPILWVLFVLAAFKIIPMIFAWPFLLAPMGLVIQQQEFKYYKKHNLMIRWLRFRLKNKLGNED